MKISHCSFGVLFYLIATIAPRAAEPAAYKVLQTAQVAGTGGIDYVFADSPGRRLYVPRGQAIEVFDLDTLKPVGTIPNTRAHGVAVDSRSGHGFSSSNPVAMWNAKSLAIEKTIEVQGRPDGIFQESATGEIYILSHVSPNVTALDPKTGQVVATFDLGGAPEQGASDGHGRVYIDIEDKNNVAVIDAHSHAVLSHYDLGDNHTPAGLGLDAKNQILFVFCREPQNCVVLSATSGQVLSVLPIGKGTDGGGFNPATMEAFSSQGDGTLTIIAERSPTTFAVAQTAPTKLRAKTSTLDSEKNRIVVIATEPLPGAEAPREATSPAPAAGAPRGRGAPAGPALLDILVVGR